MGVSPRRPEAVAYDLHGKPWDAPEAVVLLCLIGFMMKAASPCLQASRTNACASLKNLLLKKNSKENTTPCTAPKAALPLSANLTITHRRSQKGSITQPPKSPLNKERTETRRASQAVQMSVWARLNWLDPLYYASSQVVRPRRNNHDVGMMSAGYFPVVQLRTSRASSVDVMRES